MRNCANCKNKDIKKALNDTLAYNCEKGHFTTEDTVDVDKETSCVDFENKLKYPVGSFISYCDEYYKVLRNSCDYSAEVVDMGGDVCNNFYFKAYGEECVLITDEKLIQELEAYLKEAEAKKKAYYDRLFGRTNSIG